MAGEAGRGLGRIALIVVTVLLILAAVGGLVAWRSHPQVFQSRQDREWDARAEQLDAVEMAKAAVSIRAPNVVSLVFGEAKVSGPRGARIVCGTVDLVQADEDFSGPQRFVWANGEAMLEELDGAEAINRQWDAVCKAA